MARLAQRVLGIPGLRGCARPAVQNTEVPAVQTSSCRNRLTEDRSVISGRLAVEYARRTYILVYRAIAKL